MGLLKSVYSNPMESGIRAFRAVSDIFGDIEDREARKEDRAIRRQLMSQEQARNELLMEKTRNDMKYQEEEREHLKKLRQEQEQQIFDTRTLRTLQAAKERVRQNQPLSDDEETAVLMASNRAVNWAGKNPDEITEINRSLKGLKDGIRGIWPVIEAQMQKGGGYVERAQAPELFSAFDGIPTYGGAVGRGADRNGATEGVTKKVERFYFDPKTQTMTPYLRVTDATGKEYYAPMTFDRGNDPNAPVVQLPLPIFNAHLQAQSEFADSLDVLRMKYGDADLIKRREQAEELATKSEAFLAGEKAVTDLLITNPRATSNQIRNAYSVAVRDKAKDLKIGIPQSEITAGAKEYLGEKEATNEWTIRERAAKGDSSAQKVLNQKQREELQKEGVKAAAAEGKEARKDAKEKAKEDEKKRIDYNKKYYKAVETYNKEKVEIGENAATANWDETIRNLRDEYPDIAESALAARYSKGGKAQRGGPQKQTFDVKIPKDGVIDQKAFSDLQAMYKQEAGEKASKEGFKSFLKQNNVKGVRQ